MSKKFELGFDYSFAGDGWEGDQWPTPEEGRAIIEGHVKDYNGVLTCYDHVGPGGGIPSVRAEFPTKSDRDSFWENHMFGDVDELE